MIPERRSRHNGIDLKPIHNVKEALRAVSRTSRLHSGRQSLTATYFLILELRSAATARKSVVYGKSVSLRVELVGCLCINIKHRRPCNSTSHIHNSITQSIK